MGKGGLMGIGMSAKYSELVVISLFPFETTDWLLIKDYIARAVWCFFFFFFS